MSKIPVKIIFLLAIFCISFGIWYSPVIFKGYAPYKMTELLPIARNLRQAGLFGLENERGVVLSSSLIKQEGEVSSVGNKLAAYLYAGIFKVTGVLSPEKLVIVSIILNSLALLIFSWIILALFGYKIAVPFSLIYLAMPNNWTSVYSLGTYEWPMLFISLFFLFFILGRGRHREFGYFFLAGIFLSLAGMAREAFFLLIPITAVFFWFNHSRKSFWYFLLACILILSIFYLPNFFKKDGGNFYWRMFSVQQDSGKLANYATYGHLYPDPYTYLYERNEYLSQYIEQADSTGFFDSLQRKKVLVNMGERAMGPGDRLKLGAILLAGHLGYFISFEEVGGPFILFFAILGLIYLREKDRPLYGFIKYWIPLSLFLMSFVVMVSRSHLRDFSWLLPFLSALGLYYFSFLLEKQLNFSSKKALILYSSVILIFTYNLLLADHLSLAKLYDGVIVPELESYAGQIKNSRLSNESVVAVNLNPRHQMVLNYLTDESLVAFTSKTIEKLIEERKIKEVFKEFRIVSILAYGDELSKKMVDSANVANLNDSLALTAEKETSPFKSFILNLVK